MPKLRSDSTSTAEPTLLEILEKIDESKEYMQEQFRNLNNTITNMTSRITTLESTQKAIESSLEWYGKEIDNIKKKLAEWSQAREKELDEESKMKQQVQKIQSDSNLKTLTISGIPATQKENRKHIVVKLAEVMGVKDITANDLDSAFRPKKTDDSKPDATTIIIKFHSMAKRDLFYNGRKEMLKNNITTKDINLTEENKIYINEYLSRSDQHLFYLARKKRAELNYKYVWTYHGQVFMRETKSSELVKIADQEALDKL